MSGGEKQIRKHRSHPVTPYHSVKCKYLDEDYQAAYFSGHTDQYSNIISSLPESIGSTKFETGFYGG